MIRAVCLFAGVALLVVAWAGPLPEKASVSFAAHMSLHMLVVALAAPLLAVGISGRSWDPVIHRPWLFPPILASVVEMIAVWAWHVPALHHFARDSTIGFAVEQSCFLLSGLWLWLSAVGGRTPKSVAMATLADSHAPSGLSRQQGHQRRAAGVLALLLTSMHMTLLGALLVFAPRLLFAHDGPGDHLDREATHMAHDDSSSSVREWSPSEASAHVIQAERMFQQQLGGAIMLIVGGVAYLAGGIALTRQMLPLDSSPTREVDSA